MKLAVILFFIINVSYHPNQVSNQPSLIPKILKYLFCIFNLLNAIEDINGLN